MRMRQNIFLLDLFCQTIVHSYNFQASPYIFSLFQYQLEKPVNDEDYEDEDEDGEGFGGGAKKVEEVEEDPLEGQKHIS